MSPRRVAAQRLGVTVTLLALLLGGCIFSPTEKPPPPEPPRIGIPTSEVELIAKLADVYQRESYSEFENLFPKAEDNAPYLFILNDPPVGEPPNWDLTEELRIHRRMFEPENTPPGEEPVPAELWLESITISLTPNRDFSERPDLLGPPANPSNPEGLDSDRWRVTEAQYHANLLFNTQTDTDFRVNGEANFIVINDLTKEIGEDRKFLIYRWEDLGSTGKPVVSAVPAL
jgi:hypothetical protein